ncbi:MAG: hypothetical protein VYB05_11080 [Pseudomonadota bacterium]|nr:hypothetical protein [Pseudomonadota bacterium]
MSKKPGRVQPPFIQLRLELMESPAWEARTIPLMRILERLALEHMRHAGQKNGQLYVSYGQFVAAGVSRRAINPALALGEKLGLLEVIRPTGHIGGQLREPNAYRLTYLPFPDGRVTDEWKKVTEESAKAAVARLRQPGPKQKQPTSHQKVTAPVPIPAKKQHPPVPIPTKNK